MKRLHTKISAAILLVAGIGCYAPHVGAVTYTAQAVTQGCNDVVSGSSLATASCTYSLGATATASAEAGRLSVFARSIRRVSLAPVVVTSGQSARATAIFSDTINFGIQSGSLLIPIDVSGSHTFSTLPVTHTGSIGAQGWTSGELRTNSSPGYSFASGTGFGSNPSTFVQNVLLPFSGGSMNLTAVFSAFALHCAGGLPENSSCTTTANFSSSFRLLGGTVFDQSGNAMTGVSVTSQSGFDYLAGYTPHVVTPTPVPLPATFPLLVAGLGLLNVLRRRSKQC